jgi:hypothetical protein
VIARSAQPRRAYGRRFCGRDGLLRDGPVRRRAARSHLLEHAFVEMDLGRLVGIIPPRRTRLRAATSSGARGWALPARLHPSRCSSRKANGSPPRSPQSAGRGPRCCLRSLTRSRLRFLPHEWPNEADENCRGQAPCCWETNGGDVETSAPREAAKEENYSRFTIDFM